jgi:hypothetical protein
MSNRPNQPKRRIIQSLAVFTTILALSGGIAAPAYAEGLLPNTITIYTRSGGIIQKQVTDPAMLTDLMKDAMVMEDVAMMFHGGKWYMIKDHKTASGGMIFDIVGGH